MSMSRRSIPFYRQEKQFARLGIPLNRSTMCGLYHRAADLVEPIYTCILDEIAALLSAHPEIEKVRIDGHTDSGGDLASNLRLSNERAKAVQSYLVAHGISDSRLDARGKGGDKPLAPNLTRRIQERNRRVEFYITEQRK